MSKRENIPNLKENRFVSEIMDMSRELGFAEGKAASVKPAFVLHPRDFQPGNVEELRAAGYAVVMADPASVYVAYPPHSVFTREDVTRLRADARVLRDALFRQGPRPTFDFPQEEMDGKIAHGSWLTSLADRIEALLPPEGA